jgi:hypothetical protein
MPMQKLPEKFFAYGNLKPESASEESAPGKYKSCSRPIRQMLCCSTSGANLILFYRFQGTIRSLNPLDFEVRQSGIKE